MLISTFKRFNTQISIVVSSIAGILLSSGLTGKGAAIIAKMGIPKTDHFAAGIFLLAAVLLLRWYAYYEPENKHNN